MLHGADVYYVIEERAARRPPLVTDVGVRLPATLTASGLAILSSLPPAQVKAIYPNAASLLQRGGHGPASLVELRRILADVRSRGYAVEESLVTEGLASVGVPVLDHTRHPVAGISVTFEADHVDADLHAQLISAVRQAAHALSRRLGGYPRDWTRPSTGCPVVHASRRGSSVQAGCTEPRMTPWFR